MGEEILLFGVPLVTFIAAIAITFRLGRAKKERGMTGFGLIWGAFTGMMFLGMHSAPGWDALIYAIALICVSAPAAVGGLIGGLIGWHKEHDIAHG
ncbi:MAG: hypothetical protein AAFU41_14290 [Pseudomonadota bacterium]